MFTLQAIKDKKLKVFGGDQTRPNIHINDMIRVYEHFLKQPALPSGFYNAGFENMAIIDIAKLAKAEIDAEIEILPTKDIRSYRQNSDKLIATGFEPKFFVKDAILDLKRRYASGTLIEDETCYTVSWMKSLQL